jgi:hypothetical protein
MVSEWLAVRLNPKQMWMFDYKSDVTLLDLNSGNYKKKGFCMWMYFGFVRKKRNNKQTRDRVIIKITYTLISYFLVYKFLGDWNACIYYWKSQQAASSVRLELSNPS